MIAVATIYLSHTLFTFSNMSILSNSDLSSIAVVTATANVITGTATRQHGREEVGLGADERVCGGERWWRGEKG